MAWPTGYSLYDEITLTGNTVSGFVLYVSGADLTSQFWSTVRSDGGDIRASLNDGTTELPVEVVFIDTVGETAEIHVGPISKSNGTVIRLYYNGTDTAPSVSSTYGRNNVWTNETLVAHDQQDPSGSAPQIVNSTGGTSGTSAGSMTSGDSVTGKLSGKALDFDGSDDTISFGDIAALDGMSAGTWSLWVKPGATIDFIKALVAKWGSGGNGVWMLETWTNSGSNRAALFVFGGTDYGHTNTFPLVPSTWVKLDVVFDGSASGNSNRLKIYSNGSSQALTFSGTIPATTTSTTEAVRQAATDGPARLFLGVLDEVRIRTTAKSADLITDEYNNQNSPGTFYSVVAAGGGGGGGAKRLLLMGVG